jgi:UDP-2-acetamido-3-amino-2,3-dideoxy-glucuronate N-acetyltransferase
MTPKPRDVALVGAGYWGKNLARTFRDLGVLHTLCDRSPDILRQYDAGYEGILRSESFEAVLDDPRISKVAIAAPAAAHADLARRALEAGKDVYVEKPLCLSVSEGEQLCEVAARCSRVLMVGHLLQYHPCVTKLVGLARAGDLGELRHISSNRLNLGIFRTHENALWSLAPHDVSVILRLAGDVVPSRVRCVGAACVSPPIADMATVTMRFESGLRAKIDVSWLSPWKEQRLVVAGTDGLAVFDDTLPWPEKLKIYRGHVQRDASGNAVARRGPGECIAVEPREPLLAECEHFLEACGSRAAPLTDGREGLRVLRVLAAADASLERDGAEQALAGPAAFFAHPTAVIDPRAQVGPGTKIWHFSHVMEGARVGPGCSLGQNVVVSPGVAVGANVKIQNNVSLYTGLTIEDDAFLGPSCVFTNVSNPRSQVVRRSLYEETRVSRGATIGANATIVCGTSLGRYCFVAAGAVVTRDVPDYALVVGNPARQRGWMSRHGQRLDFGSAAEAVCPESGLRYRLVETASGPQVTCLDLPEESPLPEKLRVGRTAYREFKQGARSGDA